MSDHAPNGDAMLSIVPLDAARSGGGRPPAPSKTREPQERQRVPIQATETLRVRLEMNKENFSEAIGFHPTTYNGYLQKGYITKTAALAAEALIRRQQASGEIRDEIFILRIIKGAPTALRINELQHMRLNDEEYLLVPVKETRT